MSYSMTHYCTAIFGCQKATGYNQLLSREELHVGHKCVVVEHTAETIFIYASKTLDAELDSLGRRMEKGFHRKGQIPP